MISEMLTEQDYNILKKYESKFEQILKVKFALKRDLDFLDEIMPIYDRIYNQYNSHPRRQRSKCGSCGKKSSFAIAQRLANWYFRYKFKNDNKNKKI